MTAVKVKPLLNLQTILLQSLYEIGFACPVLNNIFRITDIGE